MDKLLQEDQTGPRRIVAIGECGLDYDLLHYADKASQDAAFPLHFGLAQKYNLPMYFHSRGADKEFYDIVSAHRSQFGRGVVHSFSSGKEPMLALVALDLYIGVSGASLRTLEQIEMVRAVPLDRLLVETDAPYCELKGTHEGVKYVKSKFSKQKKEKYDPSKDTTVLVKDRNEPCTLIQIVEVVAALKGVEPHVIAQTTYANTLLLFGI